MKYCGGNSKVPQPPILVEFFYTRWRLFDRYSFKVILRLTNSFIFKMCGVCEVRARSTQRTVMPYFLRYQLVWGGRTSDEISYHFRLILLLYRNPPQFPL